MRIKKSPLSLVSFQLLQSHFEFVLPAEEEVNPLVLFDSYPVDVTFSHQSLKGSKTHFQVFVEIKVNHTKKIAGYSFMVMGRGIFSLNEKKLDKIVVSNLRLFSSLNIIINNLRNIIAQQSAFAPMGVFILPPIDMQDMMKRKAEEIKQ